ncbi:MAG: hypothetical protein AAB583_01695 [Patescibacteria group bacterium]
MPHAPVIRASWKNVEKKNGWKIKKIESSLKFLRFLSPPEAASSADSFRASAEGRAIEIVGVLSGFILSRAEGVEGRLQ